ncbi:MAG: flagellar hook capping FlgD N-terminal domain-containing protein [Syntrophales bacterium]
MSAIDGITGSDATTTTSATPKTTAMSKDDFLKMLIAQLKNQDPTSPQQGTEFAAQMAQFASVEQLTNVNMALQSQNQNSLNLISAQAINLIGKEITAQAAADKDGTPGAVITGQVTAVNFKNQAASFTVNGQDIPFTALLSVRGAGG